MTDNSPQKMIENLKKCLQDFSGQNIEIVCNMLESCGKYLLNTMDEKH